MAELEREIAWIQLEHRQTAFFAQQTNFNALLFWRANRCRVSSDFPWNLFINHFQICLADNELCQLGALAQLQLTNKTMSSDYSACITPKKNINSNFDLFLWLNFVATLGVI